MRKSKPISFEDALMQVNADYAARQRKEQGRARKEFIEDAMRFGFTEKQARFLWGTLAKEDHEHWNGMVR